MKIVILPGWGQNKTHWAAVANHLSQHGCDHIIVDLPGFGTEPANPKHTTSKDIANWLDTKLATIETPFVLCGHSFGGRVAAAYAAAYPEKIASLILVGSPNLYRPDWQVRLKKTAAYILSPIKKLLPESIRRRFRSSDYQAARGSVLHTLFTTIITEDQADLLATLDVSTKLIWGADDTAAPLRIAEEMTTCIKNSTLEVIPHTGHDVHIEKPALLAGFLQNYSHHA